MELFEPLVSVLVPVYGVEKYIERCARSIFEQTYENLEIIFVNDCTPDSSIDILRRVLSEYPSRVPQTRILNHDVNKGLAAARKTALMASTGYYVQSYDSDDYVEKNMIEMMVRSAQEADADISICDYTIVYDNGISKRINVNPPLGNIACLQKIFSGDVHSSVWNKLIRRSLYFNNDIFPIDGLNMWEDLSVMFRLIFYAKKISYLPQSYYNYYVGRAGAYTSSVMNLSQQKNKIDLIILISNFFNDKDVPNEIYRAIKFYKVGALCDIAMYGNVDYYNRKKEVFQEITFFDLLRQPKYSLRSKLCGILLHYNIIFFLNFIRWFRQQIKNRIVIF